MYGMGVVTALALALADGVVDTPVAGGDGHRACRGDAVHQLAPAASLTDARLFDGATRYAELLRLGNIGLGALSPLEGEVIALEGVAYHADVDGRLSELGADATTSFATLKCFEADDRWSLPAVAGLDELSSVLDSRIASSNLFHAVRVDGVFDRVRLRSVARQQPPYPSLQQVVAAQTVLELEQVEGTLVGFRFPPYMGAVNAGGWHFHFVDRKRTRGGHVLDVRGERLHMALDTSRAFYLILPNDPAFDAAAFDGKEGGSMSDAISPANAKPDSR